MANALQLRRGTTTQHSTFTGLAGEVTVDTTKNTIVVHDGSTAGGYPLASSLSSLGITASAADLNTTDVATLGTVEASKVVTADVSGNVTFADNDKAIFGTGSDLQIFHDSDASSGEGSVGSYIKEGGTGDLRIRASNLQLQSSGGERYMTGTENGSAVLFYDDTEKLATYSYGVSVIGQLLCDDEIQVETSSGYGRIEVGGPDGAFLDLKSPFSDDYDGRVVYDAGGSGALILTTNAANSSPVIIRQQNSEKLRTTSAGIDVTGALVADKFANGSLGTSAKVEIDANGTGGTVGLHINKDDTTGYFVQYEADLGTNNNRTLTLAPPTTDDANEPFVYSTGNSVAWNVDGTEALRINSSGTVVLAQAPKETVYSLTGTDINPDNGGVQTKTLSANTTFTESLGDGQSVVLHLSGGASYTVTWPTMTWVGPSGNTAPTLTANDVIVVWKTGSTLYGAYVGSAA